MFLLLAELNAHPDATHEVGAILQELASAAHREPGNLVYAVHQALETPCHFVVYELYQDKSACDIHLASAPVQQALARFDILLAAAPRIIFCSTIASKGLSPRIAGTVA
ncbi:hypothetical protein GCM10027343_13040 [Noviherbaspirillum agri]